MEQTPHIAILSSPGMGQLIPVVELAKQLVRHHKFSVTIIIPTSGSPLKAQKSVLEGLPESVDHFFLPPVDFEDLGQDISLVVKIFLTVTRSISFIRDALRSLIARVPLVALIVDAFGTDAFQVARELRVTPYLFFAANALALSFCLYLPKLDEMVSCEYKDLPEPVRIPGCVPIHGRELLDPVQDRSQEAYRSFLYSSKRFNLAEGILLNSFLDLEEGAIKALQGKEPGRPLIYPIGPLVRASSRTGEERPECLLWLDNQPSASVLFVSFGSGGTLSSEQLSELAFGLEESGHRFLWVVRSPNDKSANAAFFSVQSENDPFGFLPKGFLERTQKQGFVVSSWAPQAEILGHSSTGGFLTHCGWNSVLESVVHGVPMIAWPLYAEQKMTAVMLTEGLVVALRPSVDENGVVRRGEVINVVKGLMEGEGVKLRDKMKELKDAAIKVLGTDGSSMKSLSQFAMKLNNPEFI